jgi:dihydroxyacetone kinase-like protein
MMLDIILPDFPIAHGDEVAVLVSGLGATPLMEQYILYADVAELLAQAGVKVSLRLVGNFFTSLEMMGVTLTITRLDDELKELFAYPCSSIGWTVPAR